MSSGKERENGGISLSPQRAESVQRILTALRRDTVTQCVLLAHRGGRLVAEAGSIPEGFNERILPILLDEVGVVKRLGQEWNGGAVLSLHHYEGGRYEIYAASAADAPYLLVAVTWPRPPAYSGVIWLFVRRAIQDLRWILRDVSQPGGELDAVSAGQLTTDQAREMGLVTEAQGKPHDQA